MHGVKRVTMARQMKIYLKAHRRFTPPTQPRDNGNARWAMMRRRARTCALDGRGESGMTALD